MSTSTPARPGEAHPTRPASPAHLHWLREELADWEREGLVDQSQATVLLDRYHPARRMSLARLLLALGAVFMGFGLIWLVAANLDQLRPATRFAAVALLWVAATVGAELVAARREHGGPIPSPVVHFARLLAALLFGAVVFQAAQSLQVPAYEPRLVGLWALGALMHGYLVRGLAPIVVGLVAGLTWVIWSAAWTDPSALGIVLAVALAGTGAVSVAALHTLRPVAAQEDRSLDGLRGPLARGWSPRPARRALCGCAAVPRHPRLHLAPLAGRPARGGRLPRGGSRRPHPPTSVDEVGLGRAAWARRRPPCWRCCCWRGTPGRMPTRWALPIGPTPDWPS